MSRYIDADKATDRAYQLNFDKKISERELAIVNRLFAESLTEDVAPIVHGEWITQKYQNSVDSCLYDKYICSVCGAIEYRKYKYCHCGARMSESKPEKLSIEELKQLAEAAIKNATEEVERDYYLYPGIGDNK